MHKSIMSILSVGKKHFVIFPISFILSIFFYRAKLVYCLKLDKAITKKIDYI